MMHCVFLKKNVLFRTNEITSRRISNISNCCQESHSEAVHIAAAPGRARISGEGVCKISNSRSRRTAGKRTKQGGSGAQVYNRTWAPLADHWFHGGKPIANHFAKNLNYFEPLLKIAERGFEHRCSSRQGPHLGGGGRELAVATTRGQKQ